MKRYSKKSKIKKIVVKRGQDKASFFSEIINKPSELLTINSLEKCTIEVRDLVSNNWGDFGESFIKNHVLSSDSLLLLRDDKNKLVGLASISKKNILGKEINYFELTVVDKEYESLKLAFKMNYLLIKKVILENFLRFKFSLEFMLISPNMKILGSLANMADFIYPDPYKFNLKKKEIPEADAESWALAKELIKTSENPNRRILREGLVLEGSYKNTPWLLYEVDAVPKYIDEIVNEFGEHYLEYSKRKDREFIVRLKFTFSNIIKSLLK